MTEFRTSLGLLTLSTTVVLMTGAGPANAYELERVWVKSWSTSGDADLPSAPTLKTPGAPRADLEGRDFLVWQRGPVKEPHGKSLTAGPGSTPGAGKTLKAK